jgi:hypothetical protein
MQFSFGFLGFISCRGAQAFPAVFWTARLFAEAVNSPLNSPPNSPLNSLPNSLKKNAGSRIVRNPAFF